MNYDSIIERQSRDNLRAFEIADAIQKHPAVEVINVHFDGHIFRVWAKFDSSQVNLDDLDKLVDAENGKEKNGSLL